MSKIMTFGRDVLSHAIECKYLNEALEVEFLSPLILQNMKEDNISQLGDYDAPLNNNTRMGLVISL